MTNKIRIIIAAILLGVVLASFSFDSALSEFFSGPKINAFGAFLSVITNFSFVAVFFVLIPTIIFYNKKKRQEILILWLLATLSTAVSFLMKMIFARQRPLETLSYPFFHALDYSFPSMHAMVIFSILPLLVKMLPRQRNFWVSMAFLIAFSRIYFDFHFISDVIFGAVFGYITGILIIKFSEKYAKSKKREIQAKQI